jgi:drug/metabolite transporter (DMT)-like permease
VPALALAFIVVAAFIHATWNLLAKRAAGGAPFVWLYGVASALLYLPAAALYLALAPGALGPRTWALFAASGVLHLLYALSLQRGYRVADLTVVYPVARGTGPLLSTAGAIALLGERPGPIALTGAAAVVTGVLVLSGGPRALTRGDLGVGRGVLYGAFTGLFIAAYTLLDGHGVKTAAVAPFLLDYFGNLVRCALLTPAAFRHRSEVAAQWRRSRALVAGVGALAPLSYVLVLAAARMAPLSRVAPAREVSLLVAAVLGARWQRERDAGWRLAGAGVIVLGVVALAMG